MCIYYIYICTYIIVIYLHYKTKTTILQIARLDQISSVDTWTPVRQLIASVGVTAVVEDHDKDTDPQINWLV